MDCTFCLDQMDEVTRQSVQIDICQDCGGHFFEAEELGDFLKCKVTEKKMLISSHSSIKEEAGGKCPRCQSLTYRVVQQAKPNDIEFECCVSCGGMSFPLASIQAIAQLSVARQLSSTPKKNSLDAGATLASEVALVAIDTLPTRPADIGSLEDGLADGGEVLAEGVEVVAEGTEVIIETADAAGEVVLEGVGLVLEGIFEFVGELLS
jgi:uncharacterized protein